MIDQIENFMNDLTDMDWGWWPVLSLRSAKDKDIDNLLLSKLSLFFGSAVAVLFAVIIFMRTGMLAFGQIILSFLIGWLLFFIIYMFTFVYFWNRRAKRLRSNKFESVLPSKSQSDANEVTRHH